MLSRLKALFMKIPVLRSVRIYIFLLLLVMGIEFVKMLALHTADAVVDVLLFTIVRQMIVSHTDAAETLLGVAAVAGIFAVKKYLQARENAA